MNTRTRLFLGLIIFLFIGVFAVYKNASALSFYSTESVVYPNLPTGVYEELVNNYPNPAYSNTPGQFIQTFKGDGTYIQGVQFNMSGTLQSFYICKGVPDFGYGDDTCTELNGTTLYEGAYNLNLLMDSNTALLFTIPIKTLLNNDYFIVMQYNGTVNKTANLYTDGYYCYANYGWNCESNRDMNLRIFSTPTYVIERDFLDLSCPYPTYIRRNVTTYGSLIDTRVSTETMTTNDNWLTFKNNLKFELADYTYKFYEDVPTNWNTASATASTTGDLTDFYYENFDTQYLYIQATSTPATTTRYVLEVWYDISPALLSLQNFITVELDETLPVENCFLAGYPIVDSGAGNTLYNVLKTKAPLSLFYDAKTIWENIVASSTASSVTTSIQFVSSTYGVLAVDIFPVNNSGVSSFMAWFRYLIKLVLIFSFFMSIYYSALSLYHKMTN